MKPRIGVYLSKRTATKLAAAAKRRGATKSALVEAAIDRFLDSDDIDDAGALTGRIGNLSDQIAQLDRDLGIVSEIVSLHARFHLAVTPESPSLTQHGAGKRGSARFEDFTAQVQGRIHRETSRMRETKDRLGATRPNDSVRDPGERGPLAESTADEPRFSVSSRPKKMPEDTAAVREDGSAGNFPVLPRSPLH